MTRIINAAHGTRRLPLDESYISQLQRIVESVDPSIDVQITSAAQARKGTKGPRTGSVRHDVDETGHGHTSDLVLMRNGKTIRPKEDKALYSAVIRAAAPTMPGIGHYDWGIHVGGGTPAFWGPTKKGASADPDFMNAYYEGRGQKGPVAMPLKGRSRMPALAKGSREVPIPNAEEYGMVSNKAVPGIQVASTDPSIGIDPADQKDRKKSALAKASGAFAQTAQAMGPRGGPMLPPPVIVADAGTKFPSWYTENYNPDAGEVPSAAPPPPVVLAPPPVAPIAGALPTVESIIPAGRDPTIGSNMDQTEQSVKTFAESIKPNPDTHSFGYNAVAGGINDLLGADVPIWNPGADLGNYVRKSFIDNFLKTENEAGGGTITDTTQESRIADDLLFGGAAAVPGNSSASPSTGGITTIDAGTTFIPKAPPTFAPTLYPAPPEPGDVPDRPMAADIDFAPYLERMEQYKPEDLNRKEYMRERILGNLSRALAAGASGSGWSGWGGSLARAGSGFGLAQAETTDQWLADDMAREEAQRTWGLGQLDLEMKLSQRAQDIKNQNANTMYQNELDEYNQGVNYDKEKYNVDMKNIEITNATSEKAATDFYNYQNTIGQMTQDTVSDITDKHMILKKVNPEGKTTFELHKLDNPYSGLLPKEYLDTIKSMEERFPNSPEVYRMKYAPFMQQKNKWAVQAVMAEELLNSGALQQLIPEYDKLNEQAATILEKQGMYPGQTDYDKKYSTLITSLAAPYMNINDPAFLQQAAQMRSVGAIMLLGASQAGQQAPVPPAGQ